MLAKFSGVNPKGPYLSFFLKKKLFRVVFTYSVKRAREIRKVSCRSVATTAKTCAKKRDARAKLLVY